MLGFSSKLAHQQHCCATKVAAIIMGSMHSLSHNLAIFIASQFHSLIIHNLKAITAINSHKPINASQPRSLTTSPDHI